MTTILRNPSNTRLLAMIALVLVLSTALAPYGQAQSFRHPVRIENRSSYDIREVYLSPASSSYWHQDVLGDDILRTGFVLTTYRTVGYYDLRLVDEDGDVCVVANVSVSGDTNWVITNSWLLNCEFH